MSVKKKEYRMNQSDMLREGANRMLPLKKWKTQQKQEITAEQVFFMMRPLMEAVKQLHDTGMGYKNMGLQHIYINIGCHTATRLKSCLQRTKILEYIRQHRIQIKGICPVSCAENDIREDIYALCAVMYCMISGREYKDETQLEKLKIEEWQCEILRRGLSENTKREYRTIEQLLQAIDEGEDGYNRGKKPGILMLPKEIRTVFEGVINKEDVTEIIFTDNLKSMPETALDISKQESENRVMAWMEGSTLYIGSVCGIQAQSCRHLFCDYNNAERIQFNGCLDTSTVTDMVGMFIRCEKLKEVDLENLDTSSVVDMDVLFFGCKSLEHFVLECWDTSKVTSMRGMFKWCENLTKITLNTIDTSCVTRMDYMFFGCKRLQEANLRGLNTSKVIAMDEMFGGCVELQKLDLSSFKLPSLQTAYRMFGGCIRLGREEIDKFIGKFLQSKMEHRKSVLWDFDTTVILDKYWGDCWNDEEWESIEEISFSDEDEEWIELATDWKDVSLYKTGEVKAGRIGNTMFIWSKQQVKAPLDCRYMFYDGFKYRRKLKRISFNNLFDTSHTINMKCMFSFCESLQELDISGFDTRHVKDMSQMFDYCGRLKSLKLGKLETGQVTDMEQMFYNCKSVEQLDVSHFDTSRVTNMHHMFAGCEKLEQLDVSGFDTTCVTDMSWMFSGCKSLKELDISGFKWDRLTDWKYMFSGCESLEYIETPDDKPIWLDKRMDTFSRCCSLTELNKTNDGRFGLKSWRFSKKNIKKIVFQSSMPESKYSSWDISKYCCGTVKAWMPDEETLCIGANGKIRAPKDCSSLFADYSSLQEIKFGDCFDTSRVKDMSQMFAGCRMLRKIDFRGCDTSAVTDMTRMFYNCDALKELDLSGFNTSLITTMCGMFHGCTNLEQIHVGKFQTNRVEDMSYMFADCMVLKNLDLSSFDTSAVTDMSGMFWGCESLESLDLSSFNTSAVTDMSSMFLRCESLKSLNLSSFNTSVVTNMNSMFGSCGKLRNLDLSHFEMTQVTDMKSMLEGVQGSIKLFLFRRQYKSRL